VEKPADEREGVTEGNSDVDRTWGKAPPYGAYRGRYSDYELAQTGSLGSGLLGGWSAVGSGGSFDVTAPTLPPPAHPPEEEPEPFPAE
jgi:hypothetical protein